MRMLPLAALLVALPFAARADTAPLPPAAAAPAVPAAEEAERVRIAVQLLDSGNYEKQVVDSAVLSGLSMFEAGLKNAMGDAAYADIPADLHDALRQTMAEELSVIAARIAPDSKDKAARVYARYFTVAELTQLARLHEEPVFRKLQSISPQLMTELMTIGIEAFQPHSAAFQARINDVIRRWLDNNKEVRPL